MPGKRAIECYRPFQHSSHLFYLPSIVNWRNVGVVKGLCRSICVGGETSVTQTGGLCADLEMMSWQHNELKVLPQSKASASLVQHNIDLVGSPLSSLIAGFAGRRPIAQGGYQRTIEVNYQQSVKMESILRRTMHKETT